MWYVDHSCGEAEVREIVERVPRGVEVRVHKGDT